MLIRTGFGLWLVFAWAIGLDSPIAKTSLLTLNTTNLPAVTPKPPLAARKDHWNTWHGERVNDPWHWLREKTDPAVIRHLEAENAYTEAMSTDVKAFGSRLYQEMLARIQQTDLSVPLRRGAYHYYTRTQEGRQYAIICRKPAASDGRLVASAPEEVLLDSNQLAEGHPYLGLGGFEVSDDGRQLLYSTDLTGFRQYTLYRKDLVCGQTSAALAERVDAFAWAADGRTIFYVTEDPVTKRSSRMWRLDLDGGAPESLMEEKDELFSLSLHRTKDRKFLVCSSASTDTWEQRILSTSEPGGQFRVLLPREKGHKYDVEHRDGLLYLRSNWKAKNFRLVTAPLNRPSQWTDVIAHRPEVLIQGIELFANHLVVQEQQEALTRLRIQDSRSKEWREVTFPEPVYHAGAGGTPEFSASAFRLSYQSMVTPLSVYDCDLATGSLTLLKRTEVLGGYDSSAFVTERRWVTTRDGARLPLSLLYRRGTALDGTAPCFLYGYGSYGIGIEADFSVERLSLVDRGLVYVIAHIRGGNELGESWHDGGMLRTKKNTFHDFIDSAEWLVANHVVARDRVVAEGASAGGLLIGAVVNQRPDLFRAVHAAVPFVDMMNTMLDSSLPLTVGEYLEWGDPNEKSAFDYMRSYSPYENLRPTNYPAMLVTTSLHDSQVMYWEPAKYVAKLRTLKTDRNPLLFKCNMGAGHGGASGRYDRLKELSFEYAWLMSQVGIVK